MYWAVMVSERAGERLVATVRRAGAVRPGALLWSLVWEDAPMPMHTAWRLYRCRHEALAAALAQYPGAAVRKFSTRGERLA